MKLILCIALIVICFLLGRAFSIQYRDRKRIMESCLSFIDYVTSEIKYKSLSIKKICKNFNINNKQFLKLVDCYYDSLRVSTSFEIVSKEFNILSNEDKTLIENLFNSIGKYDVDTQVKELGKFREECEKQRELATLDYNKYSSLYSKLGLIIGIAISILLV